LILHGVLIKNPTTQIQQQTLGANLMYHWRNSSCLGLSSDQLICRTRLVVPCCVV